MADFVDNVVEARPSGKSRRNLFASSELRESQPEFQGEVQNPRPDDFMAIQTKAF